MEESAFVRVLGSSPVVKLLDFLLVERGLYDYSMTEISENSDVSWSTLQRIFPKLLEIGVVKETRQVGRAKLYALNEIHPLVKDLVEMRMRISDYFIEQELSGQKHPMPCPQ
jgi:DNA-binding transcriptional ArsR family regulator